MPIRHIFILAIALVACGETGVQTLDSGTIATDGAVALDVAPGAIGAACASNDECNGTTICAGGTCALSDGECISDTGCDGDTYCCLEGCSTDGAGGYCVPYGSGPRGNTNAACTGSAIPGVFQASVQCEWTEPPEGDAFPQHVQVLATPLVADLGTIPASNPDATPPAEIIIVTYNNTDGGGEAAIGSNPSYFGVIRILNGQDCTQLETVGDPDHPIIAASTPAIGDLDGDGFPEIVAQQAGSGLVAFKWNAGTRRHETFWSTSDSDINDVFRWDGPSLHDLDDDGFPEIITGGEVFDGRTGARRNSGQILPQDTTENYFGAFSIVADVDGDGAVELVAGAVYRWDPSADRWADAYPGVPVGGKYAIADFGTPGAGAFDATSLDGIAEIVNVHDGVVTIATLSGDVVLRVNIPGGGEGGPPTIADFDADGLPEVATAGGTQYAVFDIECMDGAGECESMGVRWTQESQDSSSEQTGSAVFDFDGDGRAEAVYADECFTRIYDGRNGDVVYSASRTSYTWYENPVIADPDRDDNTEILVGSNSSGGVGCPGLDPIDRGTRCDTAEDCASEMCVAGFCPCETNDGCRGETRCESPLADTPGSGDVCRATHDPGTVQTGLRVLRDSLDRWAPSRPLWNQHAYSVTNANDDGTIPSTSERQRNFATEGLNNFRQNVQGARSGETQADITGRLNQNICQSEEGAATRLVSTVCNRGNRAVGAALPATFYVGPPSDGRVLCTSYTSGPVPVGGCLEVSCELTEDVRDQEVHVIVNDDGAGGATTVECNDDNNGDVVRVEECLLLI